MAGMKARSTRTFHGLWVAEKAHERLPTKILKKHNYQLRSHGSQTLAGGAVHVPEAGRARFSS